ncbi:DNA polymerase III delta prime subunit [hydrothermal vent metagenome]|uniref:DNA polymerase III subunit delta' n=1 Tax=hydrothermal vent metagenome TaxID=652676 RepID=A0A3B1D4F8_9ZZZZ
MNIQETQINFTILNRFMVLKKKERLAHAYLFSGPMDVGKGETALGVAKLVNCENLSEENYFCDVCPSCLKINSRNHPDVHVIDNEDGGTIKIDQIRGLLGQVKMRPFQALKKVFIIRNIESMTIESSNALLKTLEEPGGNSLLLLTVSSLEKILPTVRSRCHTMPFSALSLRVMARRLMSDDGEFPQEAHFLAHFAEGCLGRARCLKEDKIFIQKDAIIDQFILSSKSEDFVKKILTDKPKTKGLLDILLSWMRDSLLVKVGVEDARLIHIDRLDDLKFFVERYSFFVLNDVYEESVKTYKLLADNLNVKIPLLIIKEKLRYE